MKHLPAAPKPQGKQSSFSIYDEQFRIAKADIYDTLWELDYYIIKASATAEDFYFMMNEVQIKDLYLFVLKSFLEQ